ncbi:cysteine hydrolase family protein [Arenibacterium sp. LLYu02]|uniref:cysteine hydrolase family protein n=1 Tax=Arenibacterium sp. LLYu02 TaxID=3404132 RepID=UPI003B20C6C8
MIKYLALVAVLAIVLWLANGIRMIGAVSRGKPIASRPNTALLLVDLQTVFWEDGRYDDEKALAQSAILDEIAEMNRNDSPVIAIRQEWSQPSTMAISWLTMGGQAIAGSLGNEIAAPFEGRADFVLVKRVQDAFETGELDALLKQLDVGTLRIVGLDMNYCVGKTALAARNRGFAVEVITRGTLAAKPTEKMRELLTANGVKLE